MDINAPLVGTPRSRVDGPAKVTGTARYAGEFTTDGLLHGYVVGSAVAHGRIRAIDTAAALAVPGVVQVFTHLNRPRTAWFNASFRDQVAPPGAPMRPLYDDRVLFSGTPVALVVAEEFGIARHAASLVRVEYDPEPHETDLEAARPHAYVPPKKRSGIEPPPKPRGDAAAAMAAAPVRVGGEYVLASEYHNPMEPHATTVMWEGGGKLTVHDKTQGVGNTQAYLCGVFGLKAADVRVVAPFVGGAFGSGLRPQHQLFLATMAALALERSVRVVLTRDQMFTFTFRPETINTVQIGAGRDGTLQAVTHDALAGTSTFEDYQEVVVNWSGLLYQCDNVTLRYELAKLHTATPGDMRAPGSPTGTFAIESAIDELAYATGQDPLAVRLRNYAETDQNTGKPFTSKALREAFRQGADRFGWDRRTPAPRSMRDGRELIGWGVACGAWEAMMQKTSARAALTADGRLEVACASADIGTGTYTILTQLAAEALGLPMEHVTTRLGDTALPFSPVEGGSWTAASAGAAVNLACHSLREMLLKAARAMDASPLANADMAHVAFQNGRIVLTADPARGVGLADVLRSTGQDRMEAEETATPSKLTMLRYSAYSHAACFIEVRVDEELDVVRVTRVVSAVAGGRILNPKTARSQVVGSVVMGIGMALHEEAMTDHALGRVMNHNLGEYHVPVHADIPDIEVVFVEEHDPDVSPLGVKGLGEIGIAPVPAAVANAIFHATGKRVRSLPITIDKLLAARD